MIYVSLVTNADLMRYAISSLLAEVEDISLSVIVNSVFELRRLVSDLPSPHVVIIDERSVRIDLGDKQANTERLASNISRICNEVRGCIGLTDYVDKKVYECAPKLGFRSLCLKSISGDQLIKAIRAVADGKVYMHSEYLRIAEKLNYPLLNSLSERQIEILDLVFQGYTNNEIADKLYISLETVKWHISTILKKLKARDRTHAISLLLSEIMGGFILERGGYMPKSLKDLIRLTAS